MTFETHKLRSTDSRVQVPSLIDPNLDSRKKIINPFNELDRLVMYIRDIDYTPMYISQVSL